MTIPKIAAVAGMALCQAALCLATPNPPDVPGDSSTRATAAPADTQVIPLPFEVVITAPRMSVPLRETPAAASIVSRYALVSLPRGVSMDEAMVFVPGVKVDNQSDGERVHMSIRGQGILTETGIRSIKVLLDGLPVNDPSGFAPDLFDVDYSSLERIEVLRGPATSYYGGGGAGGVLNIITQSSPPGPLSGDVVTTAGSNNFWKGFGQFGGDVNDINYRVSLSRSTGDGYRVHTHFWENNMYARATYTPTAGFQVTPILSWSNTYHENPEGLSLDQYLGDPRLPNDDAIPYNEHMEMERSTVGLTGTWRMVENQEFTFNAYVKHSTYTEANNAAFDHQLLTTPGGSLQYTLTSGTQADRLRNRAGIGVDLQWQASDEHLNPNNYSFEGPDLLARQRITQRGVGVFLIDQLAIGPDWTLSGSVRYDAIRNELVDQMVTDSTDNSGSAYFSNVTGRIGVTYSPSQAATLYAGWGAGFIPPSTEELGTNPNGYGGFNQDLKAATSSSFEGGVRGSILRALEYDVDAFYMTTTNDFDRYRVPNRGNGEEGTFYRNVGASRRYGLEVSGRYEPVSRVGVQCAYTYSHFKYAIGSPIQILMDDPADTRYIRDGNWLPNSPRHQLALGVSWEPVPEISLSVNSLTFSRSYIDGANIEAEAAPGYTLFGAAVAWQWRVGGIAGVLTVQGRNLADTKYVAFTEPDSGGNSYQPGAGREIMGGLRIHL